MKATGIVRRIDDLGRVVLPKELRRTLGLREGDAVEVFTENNTIILAKYSVESSYSNQINNLIENMRTDYAPETTEKIKQAIDVLEQAKTILGGLDNE